MTVIDGLRLPSAVAGCVDYATGVVSNNFIHAARITPRRDNQVSQLQWIPRY